MHGLADTLMAVHHLVVQFAPITSLVDNSMESHIVITFMQSMASNGAITLMVAAEKRQIHSRVLVPESSPNLNRSLEALFAGPMFEH